MKTDGLAEEIEAIWFRHVEGTRQAFVTEVAQLCARRLRMAQEKADSGEPYAKRPVPELHRRMARKILEKPEVQARLRHYQSATPVASSAIDVSALVAKLKELGKIQGK